MNLISDYLGDREWATLLIALAHTLPVVIHQGMMMWIATNNLCAECVIQFNPSVPVSKDLHQRVWKGTFLNHFIIIPLIVWVLFPYFLQDKLTNVPTSGSFGPWPEDHWMAAKQLVLCIFIEDALFYWGHRLLHEKWFYSRIHKKHHEFKSLTAYSIASEFTHPVESLLGNVLPVMTGPILVNCNFNVLLFWIVLRMFKTCDAHCGYAFKWSPFGICWPLNPARLHDLHHESGFGICYGSFFKFWDELCGTGEASKKSDAAAAAAVVVKSAASPVKQSTASSSSPNKAVSPSPARKRAASPAPVRAKTPAKPKTRSYADVVKSVPPPKATRARSRSSSRKRK